MRLEIKNLSPMGYILGMEVARSKKGIIVSQRNIFSITLKKQE